MCSYAKSWNSKSCSHCRKQIPATDLVKVKTPSGITRLYCPDCERKRRERNRHA